MRIATWNINSVNRRLDLLMRWLESAQPDVLCLQETKCSPADFPALPLSGMGYEAAAIGSGGRNGVAIISRVGLADVTENLPQQPPWEDLVEPRALAATCAGVRVWSLYIPNGRTPDHPHYQYKLAWLASLAASAAAERAAHDDVLLLGDFNVAPTDTDVYDITKYVGSTHVTEPERTALKRIESAGFTEVLPRALKYDVAFTYWDYRQLSFPKNTGMRIDLVYASEHLAARVDDSYVDREARKGKDASDHAPIVVDLQDS